MTKFVITSVESNKSLVIENVSDAFNDWFGEVLLGGDTHQPVVLEVVDRTDSDNHVDVTIEGIQFELIED